MTDPSEDPDPRSDELERGIEREYEILHRIADNLMRGERTGHTLDATSLINEAYLRLSDGERKSWNDTVHFRASAALALRRVLVDHARGRGRAKRGGGARRVTLETRLLESNRCEIDVIELDDALECLQREDGRAARVVELRILGGLTIDETAETLQIGTATVERDWRFARAWLYSELFEDSATRATDRTS